MVTMTVPRAGQLHRSVAGIIRSRILAGELHAGDPVRLQALTDQLDVSATPVREALLMLAQDGWLAHEPNRGFVVTAVRRADVDDVYRVWAFADGEVTARAATRATTEDIAAMRVVDAEINALPEGATPVALELNERFHEVVHRVADSPKLSWFVEAGRRVAPFRVADSFEQVPGWDEMNRTQHRPIIDAIEAGDVEAARTAGRVHIETAGRLLIDWLDRLEFWSAD
jgi:DNA-binding GntR family transcriptional regulator